MTKLTRTRFVYPAVAALTLIAAGLTASALTRATTMSVQFTSRSHGPGRRRRRHLQAPRTSPSRTAERPPDRLSCIASDVSATCQIHSMIMDNGVMKMRPVEGGLEIPPGETITLKPSGLHLMLVDLKHALEPGKTVEATLRFEKAGTVKVDFPIAAIGASAPGAAAAPTGGTMMMNHGGMMQMNKQ